MTRTAFAAAALTLAAPLATAAGIEVEKTSGCGCCNAWIEHMEAHGHAVEAENLPAGLLTRSKLEKGVAPGLMSCHTATVEGYVIEGHVPAEDVARLLEERPDAIGLSVPGMPVGSPGMEMGGRVDPHDVLLIRRDGTTEVFSSHR